MLTLIYDLMIPLLMLAFFLALLALLFRKRYPKYTTGIVVIAFLTLALLQIVHILPYKYGFPTSRLLYFALITVAFFAWAIVKKDRLVTVMAAVLTVILFVSYLLPYIFGAQVMFELAMRLLG